LNVVSHKKIRSHWRPQTHDALPRSREVGEWGVLGALGFLETEAYDGGFLSGVLHDVGHIFHGPQEVEVVHVGRRVNPGETLSNPY
jgi:hypothetical protein